MSYKRPESVLIVVYTDRLDCLVLNRVDPPGFWQSVTGTLRWGEGHAAAAARELAEETGLDPAGLEDAGLRQRFPILPAWRHRFAPGVEENLEHLWYLRLLEACEIRLNAAEHSEYRWLPAAAAAAKVSSWTNRNAIERLLASQGAR